MEIASRARNLPTAFELGFRLTLAKNDYAHEAKSTLLSSLQRYARADAELAALRPEYRNAVPNFCQLFV